ncbi:Primase C terminal 2 (PriCT-2) family protein [Leishmania donovani]|uniref:Primase C terminal 2 (PriCT-2) family protein n=1 Tax=Leishmania donovani TaxID=5661 RepID=A0A504Y463_LEIDO|nr:Primase C terminal 2 (PriCT-2) family protein [Leishmania donovani]
MRPYAHLLQRCLGGALHNSPLLFASAKSRSSGSGGGRAVAAVAPPNRIENDGELLRSTEDRYGGSAGSRRRQRPTTAQLLANHGGGGSQGAVSDAVSPVERLLKKHEVSAGGGTANAIPVPSKSRQRVKNGLVAPPTRAEEPTSGGGTDDDGDDLGGALSLLPSATPAAKQQQLLTNPFRGLHADVTRSYRVDQLREVATAADLMLARQEKKSTAFSFLHFRAGERFYQGHWGSVADMQAQFDAFTEAAQTTLSKRISRPYLRGTPIPGLTLFNNDLGLQSPLVQCSYPLIVAQRLLLFPDYLRHFHTICGRENVPCDFYADIDLPGESAAGAEKMLLEVLNYLEVRLPGVGFTDPFFLVLTNAVPSRDKVSYHIHARSFTHMKNRPLASNAEASTNGKAKRKSARQMKAKAAASAPAAPADRKFDEDDIDEEHDEDPYDDLSDMVSAVDAGGKGSTSSRGGSAATPKVVAFQDYRAVKLIADEVNQTIGRDIVDHNCYRTNGMLRCAFSAKMPSAQDHNYHQQTDNGAAAARKRLVPLVTASDPALQQRLSETESVLRTMTDPEVLELTFVTRHLDADAKVIKAARKHATSLLAHESDAPAESAEQLHRAAVLDATTRHRFKLIRPRQIMGPQATQAVEYDAYGNVVPPFLTEAAKWRRFKAVTAKLRTLPPRAAESYDVWVRVGLALHNFSNEDHVFEEWVRFSLKSPLKYSREVCRKKWMQFERNPDALNWRRGFNYLNSTVWRQV